MSERFHTVILVPHSRAKMRKWRVSSRQLQVGISVLATAVVGAGLGLWLLTRSPNQVGEIEKLRTDNESLRELNHSFETSIRRLQQQLSSYEERTRRLAIAAGIDSLAGSDSAGIGGSSTTFDSYSSFLESVEIRSGQLESQLGQVENQLGERTKLIASTPAIAPVRGILTSGFGLRKDPMTGRNAFHPALDISAPAGYPVKASADGVVLGAGPSGSLGKAIFVSHGFGITTTYGHLSRIDVRPGQKIRRGEVIGRVGNTGRATGYHLHYEVHRDGAAVNPLGFILDSGAH